MKTAVSVTPQNLQFNTTGRDLSKLMGEIYVASFIGFFMGWVGNSLSVLMITSISCAILVLIVWSVRKYAEFYFYDNAIVIKLFRFGNDTGHEVILNPVQMVSVFFEYGNNYNPERVTFNCVESGKAVARQWSYSHLRHEDFEAFKENMKTFCEKNKVGFKAHQTFPSFGSRF